MGRLCWVETAGRHPWRGHRKQTARADVVEMRACSDAARCLPHPGLALLFQTVLEALVLGKVELRSS